VDSRARNGVVSVRKIEGAVMPSITYIFNLRQPEQGGVGRYVYEILRRAQNDIEFNEIDSSPYFGNTEYQKLKWMLLKRKKFLIDNIDNFGDINHFLQVESFFDLHRGKNVVTFHYSPPFSVHNSLSYIYGDVSNLAISLLVYRRYADAIKHADFIIANSEFTREGILAHDVDQSRVKTVPLGVDDRFQIEKRFSERENTFGYIGSFARHKRADKALQDYEQNAHRLKHFKFELGGNGGAEFRQLCARYSERHNITFLGNVPEKDMVKVHNSFKAFVFPTKKESFGLPMIEAVASGTPVFIYEDAEIPPEVRKYTTTMSSVAEIPAALEELTDNYLETLSKQIKSEFNWDKHYEETKRIYLSI
jgi:glycosyltransferase involved in cell wall biosynthesis